MNALGRHVLVEYYECNPDTLNDVVKIEESMVAAAKKAEATVINSTFHHFSPFGVSGVVVIQESHLTIHTWPEYGYAAVDIFTCGDTVDPWICFKFLETALGASYASAMEMLRGQPDQLKKVDFELSAPRTETTDVQQIVSNRNVWFTERDDSVAFSLRHKGDRLFSGQSGFQKVEVYDTYAYGRLLTLDGMVMTSEGDEYVYHEMIAHVPLQVLPEASSVLIIGGGDGGVAREVLRYPRVEKVVMVEIDAMVVQASRDYLPKIATEFDNPRLELHIEDGIKFVQNSADACYDLVIVDSTDPVGPGKGLFSEAFYEDVYRILQPNGVMVTQSESPRYNKKVFCEVYECYRGIFGADHVHCYLSYVPTYPTGMWSMSFSAKGNSHPLNDLYADKADRFAAAQQLKYYNPDIHRAAFAMPNFVREMLKPIPVHE